MIIRKVNTNFNKLRAREYHSQPIRLMSLVHLVNYELNHQIRTPPESELLRKF